MLDFEDLKDRVVIDWGRSTRSWHQWLRPKEVIENLPQEHVGEFPGYLDFILDHDELRTIVENASANKIWHTMLKAVSGVYLKVDSKTGRQYVGSAYGKNGILGQWRQYAKNGHGGNHMLKCLLKDNKDYARNFRFTILRTLPRTITQREVIRFEQQYKHKLGSTTFGLNLK